MRTSKERIGLALQNIRRLRLTWHIKYSGQTAPTDYSAIRQMRLKRFDSTRWVPRGGIISE